MNDQGVTFSGCKGDLPFAAITVARDATDTRKLADARGGAAQRLRPAPRMPSGQRRALGAPNGRRPGAVASRPGRQCGASVPLGRRRRSRPRRDWNPAPQAPAAAPAAGHGGRRTSGGGESGELWRSGRRVSWWGRRARGSRCRRRPRQNCGIGSRRGRSRRPRRALVAVAEAAAAGRDLAIAAATAARDSAIAAARAAAGPPPGRARDEAAGRGASEPNKKPKRRRANPRRPRRAPNATSRRRSSTRRRLSCDKLRAPGARRAADLLSEEGGADGKWPRRRWASTPDEGRSRLEDRSRRAPTPASARPPAIERRGRVRKDLNRKAENRTQTGPAQGRGSAGGGGRR